MGDGAWGVSTRDVGLDYQDRAWYLNKAISKRHFILLTLHGKQRHMKVISSQGHIIDEYPRTKISLD